ncbi:hypothetical protein CRENBAI_021012 [Crenichthys baileyi]|uniref:Uncharacterized protein n=1 Tax=Crenichthys baileyi TaxID=28760 RepID=A0AAV9QRA4_9TELE
MLTRLVFLTFSTKVSRWTHLIILTSSRKASRWTCLLFFTSSTKVPRWTRLVFLTSLVKASWWIRLVLLTLHNNPNAELLGSDADHLGSSADHLGSQCRFQSLIEGSSGAPRGPAEAGFTEGHLFFVANHQRGFPRVLYAPGPTSRQGSPKVLHASQSASRLFSLPNSQAPSQPHGPLP